MSTVGKVPSDFRDWGNFVNLLSVVWLLVHLREEESDFFFS